MYSVTWKQLKNTELTRRLRHFIEFICCGPLRFKFSLPVVILFLFLNIEITISESSWSELSSLLVNCWPHRFWSFNKSLLSSSFFSAQLLKFSQPPTSPLFYLQWGQGLWVWRRQGVPGTAACPGRYGCERLLLPNSCPGICFAHWNREFRCVALPVCVLFGM